MFDGRPEHSQNFTTRFIPSIIAWQVPQVPHRLLVRAHLEGDVYTQRLGDTGPRLDQLVAAEVQMQQLGVAGDGLAKRVPGQVLHTPSETFNQVSSLKHCAQHVELLRVQSLIAQVTAAPTTTATPNQIGYALVPD